LAPAFAGAISLCGDRFQHRRERRDPCCPLSGGWARVDAEAA